jgi:AcrR family transcriptional regulator
MDADRHTKEDEPRDPSPADRERAHLRAALRDLLADQSYTQLRLPDLLRAADISEPDFTALYENLDACFAELCQVFMRESAEQTFAAYAAESNWRDGMRAQIWAAHDFLIADPLRARIAVIDVNFGGDRVLAIRDLFMLAFTELVHLGRHESAAGDVPRERAEAFAGASWELIAPPIRSGSPELLSEVVPQLLYMLYLPYLGEAQARAELARARAEVERRGAEIPPLD